MKLTVLMAVYQNDSPADLTAALASIYDEQTVKPDEIVIVLDGPIGAALESAIAEFSSARPNLVRTVPLAENRGLGVALAEGEKHCSHPLIARMDADDISLPHRFEKQLDYLAAHPGIGVVGGYCAEFHDLAEPIGRVRIVPQYHEEIVEMSRRRAPMNHVTVMMRREALEAVGGYQPLPLLEDYYLWLRMIHAGIKLGNLPETLVRVRIGNGFIARRRAGARISGWKTLQTYMLQNGMIDRRQARLNMVFIRAFVYLPSGLKDFVYRHLLRR